MEEKKMYNPDWHLCEYCSYGCLHPLENKEKDYTMLYHYPSGMSEQYVVAYHYCKDDNSWGQGHYFNDFYSALRFMFAPVED